MLRRIFAIAKKEVRQFKRDRKMMIVLFFFPVFLLAIFGYAINFDVHHIQIAVLDQDKSEDTRKFVNMLTSSDYFDITAVINSTSQINKVLDERSAQAVIIIPENFSRLRYSAQDSKIQVLVDGVNGNTATIILNYLSQATYNFSNKFSKDRFAFVGRKMYEPLEFHPVFWYNPSLESTVYLIPGLIAMIMIVTGVIAIAMSLVKEKEQGTIEQINVSPLNSFELIIGKTVPQAIFTLLIACLILVASHFMFGITVKGSYFWLLITTFLFTLSALSMGILISAIAESQQVAFQVASLASMLPSIILSGFIFPIESMPAFIQLLTNLTPAKFYTVILRDILVKGVGVEAFFDQMIYLMIFTAILTTLAIYKTAKQK